MRTIPMTRLRRELNQHLRLITQNQAVILVTRNKKAIAYLISPTLIDTEILASCKEKEYLERVIANNQEQDPGIEF